MSEDPTKPMLEAILKELWEFRASVESRLEKLESKQYDTKPIWERALKEIAETRQEMNARFEEMGARFNDLDGRIVVLGSAVLKLRALSLVGSPFGRPPYGRAPYGSAPPTESGTPEDTESADKKKPS